MNDRTIFKLMTLLLAANGLSATQAADDNPAQRDAVTRTTATDHSAPFGPIQFSYEILATPAVGRPIEVKIVVSPSLPFAGLTLQVYAHDGLIVAPFEFSVTEPDVGAPIESALTVTPQVEGSLRLSVIALGESEGESQAGQLTVPIQVGPASRAVVPTRTIISSDDETIISLPAREN